MNALLNQINGLFNDAIEREEKKISRLRCFIPADSVPGNGNITSLCPTTATPTSDVPPVANVGGGNQNKNL